METSEHITWQCRDCCEVFSENKLAKITHKYGNAIVSEPACPVCGGRNITAMSLPWNLKLIDDSVKYLPSINDKEQDQEQED